jgi:hypothetical protein
MFIKENPQVGMKVATGVGVGVFGRAGITGFRQAKGAKQQRLNKRNAKFFFIFYSSLK